jgi:signal transduction histidine kinase
MNAVSVRHELTPRQLRALLFLLVLLPSSPTILMFRFMVQTVRDEHAATEEQLGYIYRQALATATTSLRNHRSPGPPQPSAILQYYTRELDPEVAPQISGSNGDILAGIAHPNARPIAQDSLAGILPGAQVRLFLTAHPGPLFVDERITTYGWAVAIVAFVNVLISGAAAVALHRQSQLRDLQNSALATVAHEMRTPLASMRVLTDTLLDSAAAQNNSTAINGDTTQNSTRTRDYAQLIATENDRLVRLTENFLNLSRYESSELTPKAIKVDPEALAAMAIRSLEFRFREASIEPHTQFDPDLPQVLANPESMSVVLANLLDNAIKYSNPSNNTDHAHNPTNNSNPPVTLRIRKSNQTVRFEVQDQGIGIPPELQPRIFESFYQANQMLARTREGCGLGLHIARTIVRAHKGEIQVQSTAGKGSTFTVTLPAVI